MPSKKIKNATEGKTKKATVKKSVRKAVSKKEAAAITISKKKRSAKKPSVKRTSRKPARGGSAFSGKKAAFIEPSQVVGESIFQKETRHNFASQNQGGQAEVIQDKEHGVVVFIKKTLPALHRIFFTACAAVFFLTLTLVSLSVLAAPDTLPSNPLFNDVTAAGNSAYGGQTESVGTIVAKVIQVILGLLGLIFLVLIIYAGFLWMTDKGDEEQVKKSRQMILHSMIGVAIVVAAYTITQWVLTQLIESIK